MRTQTRIFTPVHAGWHKRASEAMIKSCPSPAGFGVQPSAVASTQTQDPFAARCMAGDSLPSLPCCVHTDGGLSGLPGSGATFCEANSDLPTHKLVPIHLPIPTRAHSTPIPSSTREEERAPPKETPSETRKRVDTTKQHLASRRLSSGAIRLITTSFDHISQYFCPTGLVLWWVDWSLCCPMAFWVVGGGNPLGDAAAASSTAGQVAYIKRGNYSNGSEALGSNGKRRGYEYADGTASACSNAGCYGITKRPRLDDWGRVIGYHGKGHHAAGCEHKQHSGDAVMPDASSIHVKNLAFLVIREHEPSPPPTPPPQSDHRAGFPPPPPHLGPSFMSMSAPMERTQSGLSISSDTSAVEPPCDQEGDCDHHDHPPLLSDLAAARLVRRHVANIRRWKHRDSQHGRILKALINPKSREADFPLDNDALRSIFSAANELFFANKLTQRVTWDWSHPASAQYESHIVGTTALRRSARLGGYETLIVLSSPILKDTKYNRRLLISTFLHEMIHSFLFIVCGITARHQGGHTEGFRQIAEIIDEWVGKEHLRLRDMEADLERFIHEDHPPAINSYTTMDDGMPHLNNYHYYNNSNNNNNNNNGNTSDTVWPSTEWHHAEAQDYRTIEAPQPYTRYPSNHDEWEWHDREGFPAHVLPSYHY
ncbi:hypothetical protein THAR02_05493 [Trichoderma harzianum]|uniref:SprT-like domain-containing protein n=1 Tax=Trichoderma harzianum TaxID=5544 RepID=A0A0F9ZQ64_TRIHA|nr:hypothetical protein THAR02_05493 [Trichoderma harzianum]